MRTRWALSAGVLLLGGCSRAVIDPSKGDLEKAMNALSYSGRVLTDHDVEESRTSESARRAAIKRVLIEPVESMGFDFERSLQTCVRRSLAGDYPPEEGQLLTGFISIYVQNRAELEHYGLISQDTAALLDQVGH